MILDTIKTYLIIALAVIVVSAGGYIYLLDLKNDIKDSTIAGLKIDLETAIRDTEIKVLEAVTQALKDQANEDINSTLSDTSVVTGNIWLQRKP